MNALPAPYREITDLRGRLFVIGDIHACLSELETLLDYLSSKCAIGPEDTVAFIGDYIDRGPCSKEVIDLLLAFRKTQQNVIFLKGNHEVMLLDFLNGASEEGSVYLQNGGSETAKSYGARSPVTPNTLAAVIPPEHREFFDALDRYCIAGKYVLVHAGLNPLRDLYMQLDSDIFWIRDEFIRYIHGFDKMVVFGHTPFEEVLVHLPYKIGIDTGCVFGNLLSCVELVESRVLQVAAGERKVRESHLKVD